MRVTIALKLTEELPQIDCDYIGADKGALLLAQNNIEMEVAIGDFDSIDQKELPFIEKHAKKLICLNPIKDDSDSEAALKEALKRGYNEIFMTGAFGGRIDHSYYNIRLAFKHPNCLKLWSRNNLVYALKEGVYNIEKENYKYISFFAEEHARITLEGFEYPLKEQNLTKDDIYTLSNSIVDQCGVLTVHEGNVLVIQSNDEK